MTLGEGPGYNPGGEIADPIERRLQALLAPADIILNGSRPWDPQIRDRHIYNRVAKAGVIGIGEGYTEGEWDCGSLDELTARAYKAGLEDVLRGNFILKALQFANGIKDRLHPDYHKVAEMHYNLGNEFYEGMLDKRMQYTCGYWKDANTLDQAQEAKLHLIARKLGLKGGMKVLEMGGGWGGSAKFYAENYGVSVVNVTISEEQAAYSVERTQGLPVETRLGDVRAIKDGPIYDRVLAVGLLEHIGHRDYRLYMQIAHDSLKPGGLFLSHSIVRDTSGLFKPDWTSKYIFPPPSEIPSSSQIATASADLFVAEDTQNFGAYYDSTCMAWNTNFEANWDKIKSKANIENPDKFKRMWNLYLLGSAGAFRSRSLQLQQIVFSKGGVPGGYESVR